MGGRHGLTFSIMQPLPLASRYAGAAGKQESTFSPASALGSAWIRRFLPSSDASPQTGGANLEPAVDLMPIDDKQPTDVGGEIDGSNPPPLLLHHSPDEALLERVVEVGVAVDDTQHSAVRLSRSGQQMPSVKASQVSEVRGETTTASHNFGTNGIQDTDRSITTLPTQPWNIASYGNSDMRVDGNLGHLGAMVPTHGTPQVYGCFEPEMITFGSFRVPKKPSTNEFRKVTQPVSYSKPKGPVLECEPKAEGALPVVSSGKNLRLDLKQTTMIESEYGAKCTALPMSTLLKESNMWGESGRPSRPVDSSGAWGFLRAKKLGVELESGGPSMFRPNQARVTAPYVVSNSLGEDSLTQSRAVEVAIAKPSVGGDLLEHPNNRKLKEVVYSVPSGKRKGDCVLSGKRKGDVESLEKTQQSVTVSPFAPHQLQAGSCLGKLGQPLPFTPHSSFPDEDGQAKPREDGRNSRGWAEPSNSLLTPYPQWNGLDGGSRQADGSHLWGSTFAPVNGLRHMKPPIEPSSSAKLPVDTHARIFKQPTSTNFLAEASEFGRNQEERSRGGPGKHGAFMHSVSLFGRARNPYDNLSSNVSSSAWPENEVNHGNDDAGTRPCSSNGIGSGFQSHASRSVDWTTNGSSGQYLSAQKWEAGGAGGTVRKNVDSKVLESPRPLRRSSPLSLSGGRKEDTSASSPPSRPSGYNSSSDLDSPIPFLGIARKGLINRSVNNSSEMEGSDFRKWHQVHRNTSGTSGLPNKTVDGQTAHPPSWDGHGEVGGDIGRSNDSELKLGKEQMAGEEMREVGPPGPSKKSRYEPDLNCKDFQSNPDGPGSHERKQGVDDGEIPSMWLQRWAASSKPTKTSNGFLGVPKQNVGMTFTNSPGSSRQKSSLRSSTKIGVKSNMISIGKGKRIHEVKRSTGWPVVKNISKNQGVYGIPPAQTPSAAALALVGTTARKIGPILQERRGSVLKWSSIQFSS